MIALCYYVHRGSVQCFPQVISSEYIPADLTITINDSLSEQIMTDRFDPRKDWDQWVSGHDPLTKRFRCRGIGHFGLMYFDDALFPLMKSIVEEPPQYHGFAWDMTNRGSVLTVNP